ncbi:uncharacterized protein LOC118805288 [Colossoma macropomum]|uniref:uncharacterized protein LOC118805288 n=1 Tax=Colossoma macropomum TaxID=42526 RepID=UPI001863B2C9|nr:uncharacterized protein LOC118805288 [Colossoma macropomum]
MERSSPPPKKPSWTVTSFGSCASCSLTLCSSSGPQLLPCLHAVCKDCISPSSEECPSCEEKYELEEIISNFHFDELSTNPKESIKCQGCEDPSVTGWCVDCQENLCTGCVAAHKRVKSAQEHYVHTITPVSPRPVACPIHKKELVNCYCLTCDQLICKLCRPFHLRHLLQDAQEAVGRQRKQIQRMAQKVQQKRLTVQKNRSDLEKRLSDLEDLQARVRLEVKETVVRLCNVIVKKAAKLNKEMKDLCGKERENLSERRSFLQRLEEKLDHVLAFTDKAVACQHHTVLLSCKRQVHHQLQELLGQVVSPTASVMELSFHTNEDKVKKVLKTFGCIIAREVPFSCCNTGNAPSPSPDHLTPNYSLSTPTVTSQKPSDPTTTVLSSLPSVSLPQQNPQASKKHSEGIHFKKTTSVPAPVSFSFSSSWNDMYYNFPNLKRAWSYHPYHPRDPPQFAQSSVKSISPQNQIKELVPSSRATPPQLTMPAFSFLHASAPVTSVSVKETSAPISTASSTKQTSCEQIGGVSVGGHQSKGFFNMDLLGRQQLPPRQRTAKLSPSEKVTEIISNVSLLPVVQATDASMALAVPFSGSQKNTKEKEPTFTLPDIHARGLLVSKGKDFNGSNQAEDRQTSFQTAKGSPFYPCDPPNGSGVALQKHSPVSATVAPFLVLSSCSVHSHAPSLPNNMLSGTVNPTVWSPALQLPLPSCKDSTAVSSHKDTTTVQKCEGTLNITVPETSPLISATEDLCSLSGANVSLPVVESRASERSTQTCVFKHEQENTDNNTMTIKAEINDLQLKTMKNFPQMRLTVKEKLEPVEENLAFTELKKTYSSTLKGEDKEGGKTTKIRDGQGNLVDLESLGRDWLPDVSVSRLPIPDFPSSFPAPAFRVTWSKESNSFQLSVIKEDDQCPAPDPISTPNYSNSSHPLLVSKLHCAACRIRGKLFQCNVCQRAFHRECHLPPVLATDGEQWQCMLCTVLSHSESAELYPDSDGPPSQCLNLRDQKKCEYLLLSLSCNKQSSVLYRPVKLSSPTSRYIDMTLVRGRLLQKLTPPYLTPGEFVSDVWLLLHTLLNSSKEVQPVKRLQQFFSKELMKVFGQSLHPSLLNDPFTGNLEEGRDSKTDAYKAKKPSGFLWRDKIKNIDL